MKSRLLAYTILLLLTGILTVGCVPVSPAISGPDIALTTIDNTETKLSDYRGSNTLIHFWATWCASCRDELTSLTRIANEVPQIRVVAIALEDEAEAVRRFVEDTAITFPVLLDRGEARGAFSVPSIPYTLMLDRFGRPRRFFDPESGAEVSELTEARLWGSSSAVERMQRTAEESEVVP